MGEDNKDVLEKKLDHPDPRVQLAAAKKILDRAGFEDPGNHKA